MAGTERIYADGGHVLDFVNKAMECLDLIGWEHAAAVLPSLIGPMVAARRRSALGGSHAGTRMNVSR